MLLIFGRAFVALALSCSCFTIAYAEDVRAIPTSFAGKRAILDGDIPLWTTKEYVDEMLARIKEAGFNVYMPTIWQGRGTTWPSKYASWDTKLTGRSKSNFDPLRYLIQRAHELGIEVHPWITLVLRQADIFSDLALEDMPQKAFDIHNPRFRELMVRLIEEVVVNYDVDGINLDYVRAVGVCTSEECQKEYRNLYNRNLKADALLFKMLPEKVPSLVEYQEKAVTGFIEEISGSIRSKKRHLLISADVFVGHAPLSQGQNSVSWVNRGLVDVILRMDYSRSINIASMDATRRELNDPDRQGLLISNMSNPAELLPGQKHFARDGKWLADTISMILKRWPETGIALYFCKYLTDDQIAALKDGPFRQPKNARHFLEDVSMNR